MNKKFFTALLVLGVVLGVVSLWSYEGIRTNQPNQKINTIGILYSGDAFEKVADGFRIGMDEIAVQHGGVKYLIKKVVGTDPKDFERATQTLVDAKVDLIFAVLDAAPAAKKVTETNQIPVVFAVGGDPVKRGLVESLQKTGNNLTGMTWLAWELSGKRLELLKKLEPSIKRVMVVGKKGAPSFEPTLRGMKPVADKIGVSIVVKEVDDFTNLNRDIFLITRKDADALYYTPDPFVARNAKAFASHAINEKLPTIFVDEYFTREGGLASYGGNYESSGKQASRIAGKILFQGQRPQDLPVESVEDIDFIINMTSAKKMGLTISSEVVDLAGVVIK